MKPMKKNYFKLACAGIAISAMVLPNAKVSAQGCVAVRYMAAGCVNNTALEPGQWSLNIGYRYLHSYKHFKKDVEQQLRTDLYKDNVINDANSADFTLTRTISKKLSIGFSIPVSHNVRTSKYEHEGTKKVLNADKTENMNATYDFNQGRHETSSRGIGDMRIVANFRLSNPDSLMSEDLVLGIGVKLPTGDYNVQGVFYKSPTTTLIKAVDQSIQLGDGGLGVVLELSTYKQLKGHLFGYGNGFYLLNPRNTNDVGTGALAGGAPSAAQIADNLKYGNVSEMSVADQYMVRFGLNYASLFTHNLSATLGVRMEGIPRWDLLGKSDGFRRPGYVVSAEPGLNYNFGKHSLGANVPVAMYRNRIKSMMDLKKPDPTTTTVFPGSFSALATTGDAAFADYLIMLTYGYRF